MSNETIGLDKILSISGKPGLFKVVMQTRTGFIAESLIDKKKVNVNIHSNVSILSEIAVYTLSEELPLREVLKKIMEKESGRPTSISHKDSKDTLEEYFFNVLPDYDEDRVYASDISSKMYFCKESGVSFMLVYLQEMIRLFFVINHCES